MSNLKQWIKKQKVLGDESILNEEQVQKIPKERSFCPWPYFVFEPKRPDLFKEEKKDA